MERCEILYCTDTVLYKFSVCKLEFVQSCYNTVLHMYCTRICSVLIILWVLVQYSTILILYCTTCDIWPLMDAGLFLQNRQHVCILNIPVSSALLQRLKKERPVREIFCSALATRKNGVWATKFLLALLRPQAYIHRKIFGQLRHLCKI